MDITIGQWPLSPPTTRMASASPDLMSMAAMQMASPPEEHAVVTVKLGPLIPYSMAICAAPRLPRIFGRKRGDTFFLVLLSYDDWVSAVSTVPARAVAITMPILSFSASISKPLSFRASLADAKAYCMKGLVSLASLPDI